MEDFEAISSPSKARKAASQAKDWAYVTNWLNKKYANSPTGVPNFERNEDTLKVLLNLAAANDTADDEEGLLHRVREETIDLLKTDEAEPLDSKLGLLESIMDEMDEKSNKLLEDLSDISGMLGIPAGDIENLDRSVLAVSREEFDTTEHLQKLETMQKYLEEELHTLHTQLEGLRDNEKYETPTDLPAKTSEWLRDKKTVEAKTREYQNRIKSNNATEHEGVKFEDLKIEEDNVVKLTGTVQSLENRIKLFHGLPSNVPEAKAEYQKLEKELQSLIQQRDRMFENLIHHDQN